MNQVAIEVPKAKDGRPLCGRAFKAGILSQEYSPCCQSKGFICLSDLDCFYENYQGEVNNGKVKK
jgi:hypothetical protein